MFKFWLLIFASISGFEKGIKMGFGWFLVILGSIFEFLWVTGLKHAHTNLEIFLTILMVCGSFTSLLKACERLPVGTAYSAFVGLGTTFVVLSDMFYFGTGFDLVKFILIVILIGAVVGLKLTSNNKA